MSIAVGWEEWISLPKLGIPALKAKVDTGAKTSSLHAFSIEKDKKDPTKLRFKVRPVTERPEIVVECVAKCTDEREVTSSNGDSELRYFIETTLKIGDQLLPIEVSLTNRESMTYKMLLGRSTLSDQFLVKPQESFLQGQLSLDIYEDFEVKETFKRSLKIAILSREHNYSTQRLIDAAEKQGHTVQVIDTLRCYMSINADKPEIHYDGKPLMDFDAVIPRIGSSITFYGMAVVRQFEMMGTYCLNTAQAIGHSRDKLLAHQLLSRKKIGMPTTGFANSPKDTQNVIKIVNGAPLVIKLLHGTQGKGVVLAETKKAAESVITAFRGLEANILVQQFMPEAAQGDIRCFVIGQKVVASMLRQAAEDEFRSNLHRGGKASKIKITPEERKTAVRAARVLGLKVAGVDIVRTADGPKVLEVNSSPGLEGIEKTSGKDIAEAIIHFLERNARPVVYKMNKQPLVTT